MGAKRPISRSWEVRASHAWSRRSYSAENSLMNLRFYFYWGALLMLLLQRGFFNLGDIVIVALKWRCFRH